MVLNYILVGCPWDISFCYRWSLGFFLSVTAVSDKVYNRSSSGQQTQTCLLLLKPLLYLKIEQRISQIEAGTGFTLGKKYVASMADVSVVCFYLNIYVNTARDKYFFPNDKTGSCFNIFRKRCRLRRNVACFQTFVNILLIACSLQGQWITWYL